MTLKTTKRGDEGSAFVISILVLFVLTVLGLAMMLTTTTEKEIAINYRWGEQAFFNADAALEYGKNLLANYALANNDFNLILPPVRDELQSQVPDETADNCTGHPEGGCLPCDPTNAGCRDYQYHIDQCDGVAPGCTRIYIGRVLNRQDGTPAMYDFRAPAGTVGDLDGDGNADIEGAFTLWVRRPMVGKRDYGDVPGLITGEPHDRVILTAEGTAPNGMGAGAGRPVSIRRLEMSLRLGGAGNTGGRKGTGPSDLTNPQSDSDASGNMNGSGISFP